MVLGVQVSEKSKPNAGMDGARTAEWILYLSV